MNKEVERIRKELTEKETLLTMGGFIQKETIKSLEKDIRFLISEIANEFLQKGILKQTLVLTSNVVVEDMLHEYISEEDGPVYDYICSFIKENMNCIISEKNKEEEKFLPSFINKESLQLLPPLEKMIITKLYNKDGERRSSKDLVNEMKYIDQKMMLKAIIVSERSYSINRDLMMRVMEEDE